MKVVGTGAPVMLTLHLESCEVEVLRDELHHRRAVMTEAAARAHERNVGLGAGASSREVETPHDELVVMAGVLDQLFRPGISNDDTVELIGPTWLLGPSIRGATAEAAHRLLTLVERYREERNCSAQDLRHAANVLTAWVRTMLDYDYVENHAMDH
jgi:hypothetical protein